MNFIFEFFNKIRATERGDFIYRNKKRVVLTLLVIVLIFTATGTVAFAFDKNKKKENSTISAQSVSSDDVISETHSVDECTSSDDASSVTSSAIKTESIVSAVKNNSTASVIKKPTVAKKPVTTQATTDYKYNTNVDIENNVFMDSLVYTGYNLKKHRADGNMWVYILASKKRGLGYLSKIGYAGGSTGYETLNGKPDIAAFERGGLVCASYVTYVYFNYLPNVAGIDTSSLTRPVKSYSAHDWYIAAKDWIKKGYSKSIPFKASKTSSGFINFKPASEIPIGSIMVFQDARNRTDHGSHVAVYAGYKNGYNWVFHVGNENGPEFCAVERMHFGPDPQWPLMVISTPSNIRMSAMLDITVNDNEGKAVSGVSLKLKRTENSKETALSSTDANGKSIKENLSFGDYQLCVTAPNGYTIDKNIIPIKLDTKNNSHNKVIITINKIPPVVSAPEASSNTSTSASDTSSGGATGTTSSVNSTVSSNVNESSEIVSSSVSSTDNSQVSSDNLDTSSSENNSTDSSATSHTDNNESNSTIN